MALVFGGLDVVHAWTRPGYQPPWQGYAFLLLSYGLSRSTHFRAGAAVASLMFPAVALSQLLISGGADTQPLAFAMLAPFFAGMFLGVGASIFYALLNLGGILLVPFLSTSHVGFVGVSESIVAAVLSGVLAVSYSMRRDWLETQRRERARMQEAQMVHMQKMEAIGRMAGGIAHDFNNLLTVIAGGVEMLTRKGVGKEIRLIESATNSARELTAQLLTLSRQGVVEHASADLSGMLKGMTKLLARIIGEDVQLEVDVGKGLDPVRLSDSQMQQILLNLAANARDAMPRGGSLRFIARNGPHQTVRLEVIDTGMGMDAATRERVFEPFFTTKAVGKGTGLGLSMVFGLVSQAGGDVQVESEPGQGTRFVLVLPRAEQVAIRPAPVSEKQPSVRNDAQGSILLVEDDARVRDLCRSVLRREGYQVWEAAEPGEAIDLFRQKAAELDLVISDVVMPNMTGVELAEVLRESHHDVPVLFMSGYAPEDVMGRGIDARHLLRKPFRPTELLQRVSAVLYGLDSQRPPAAEAASLARMPAHAGLPTQPSPSFDEADEEEVSSGAFQSGPVSSEPIESGERLVSTEPSRKAIEELTQHYLEQHRAREGKKSGGEK